MKETKREEGYEFCMLLKQLKHYLLFLLNFNTLINRVAILQQLICMCCIVHLLQDIPIIILHCTLTLHLCKCPPVSLVPINLISIHSITLFSSDVMHLFFFSLIFYCLVMVCHLLYHAQYHTISLSCLTLAELQP